MIWKKDYVRELFGPEKLTEGDLFRVNKDGREIVWCGIKTGGELFGVNKDGREIVWCRIMTEGEMSGSD